jgi:fatty-acyl-CoA synthase
MTISLMGAVSSDGLSVWPAQTDIALPRTTVGAVLQQQAAAFPDNKALVWSTGEETGVITYRELLGHARQIAYWLLARAEPGDRVAIWSRNSVEWILLEYGCALAGMVIAAWNPGWTDHEVEHADALTRPALVFVGLDVRGMDLMPRALARAGARVLPLVGLVALTADAPEKALPELTAASPFLIQFTSGTTGQAKGAVLSHGSAYDGSWLRPTLSGCGPDDVWLNVSPLSHVGGSVATILGTLAVAACYVVMPRFDAAEFLRLAKLFNVTRIGGVPTMLLAVLNHPDCTPADFRFRSVGCGGTDIPQSLIERVMRDFNAPVIATYAQSECPMISTCLPSDDAVTIATTCGRAFPHIELKIVDSVTGDVVPIGEVGEIFVRSVLTMDGYFEMPEATASTIDADGYLHTGDLGSLDEKGYLKIKGRVRDMIIRGGENIYAVEVEDALRAHPAIADAAVVGLPDSYWGQQVGAAIQLKPGHEADTDDIASIVGQRIAHFKIPRFWQVVDDFPVTPSGKVRKAELALLFAPVES